MKINFNKLSRFNDLFEIVMRNAATFSDELLESIHDSNFNLDIELKINGIGTELKALEDMVNNMELWIEGRAQEIVAEKYGDLERKAMNIDNLLAELTSEIESQLEAE